MKLVLRGAKRKSFMVIGCSVDVLKETKERDE
jgi:hypothetical protein